jgi:hypothetical protein
MKSAVKEGWRARSPSAPNFLRSLAVDFVLIGDVCTVTIRTRLPPTGMDVTWREALFLSDTSFANDESLPTPYSLSVDDDL